MINKDMYAQGLQALRKPMLPLVSIVQFLYLTGDFATPAEIVAQLPADIETGYTVYQDAASDLAPYVDLLAPLVALKAGKPIQQLVIDSAGNPVDATTATSALIAQSILSRELERINSLLCAPCHCTLCCVGPDVSMSQAYFEIPLGAGEVGSFALEQFDSATSRCKTAEDQQSLHIGGQEFYHRCDPVLIHWRRGWSLILPQESRCPNLEDSGRCLIYPDRPEVCRRPQIFPYVVEPVQHQGQSAFRLRQSLLGVIDCPYVQQLQDEIAAFAAACELEMVFRQNKG